MKKKASILIIVGLVLVLFGGYFLVFEVNTHKNNATSSDMLIFNDLINKNYYRYVGDFDSEFPPEYEGTIYSILYFQPDEKEILTDEEKYNIGVDLANKVYRMSKEELDSKILEMYNIEISYNFLETRTTGNILLIDENYVYYSLPSEKYMYFTKYIDEIDGKQRITVLEFEVSNSNEKYLEECLSSGKIPDDEEIFKQYIMEFDSKSESAKLISKKTIN